MLRRTENLFNLLCLPQGKLFLSNTFNLLCLPQGKLRQMYLLDQHIKGHLRALHEGRQKKKCEAKRMTDEWSPRESVREKQKNCYAANGRPAENEDLLHDLKGMSTR